MVKHQFKTIKDKHGNFPAYLNATKAKHRGLGYTTWRIARMAGLNKTALAKLFNTSFNTIKFSWIPLDDEEQTSKKIKQEKEVEELHD